MTNPFMGTTVDQGARYQALFPSGAGRAQCWYWPPAYATVPALTILNRSGATVGASNNIGGTGEVNIGSNNGVDCAQLRTVAAGDLVAVNFGSALNLHPRTTMGHGISPTTGDLTNVYRIVFNVAGIGTAPIDDAGHDYGCSVTRAAGTTGFVLKDGNDGWHVQIVGTNVIRLYVRGPNGLQLLNLTAAPFDTRFHHSYEMRFLSAQRAVPAQFQFLIDGVPIALPAAWASWAAGTNNPACVQTGVNTGFTPRVLNFAGNINSLLVSTVAMFAAPDLANAM